MPPAILLPGEAALVATMETVKAVSETLRVIWLDLPPETKLSIGKLIGKSADDLVAAGQSWDAFWAKLATAVSKAQP